MGTDSSSRAGSLGLSRRGFLGVAAGGAATALLRPGALVAGNRPAAAALDDYVGRLCYNENPLGPSPLAIAAIHDNAAMAHRYPDWFAESLRGDLATLHGIGQNQIIAGCGATEILRLCALAFADPAGNVVCPYPSYSQFPSDAGFLGAAVRYSDLDSEHRVDLADMASQVDGETSAVCITNPNNPTGTVLAASDIADFVDALPAQVVTIIDEAYHEFVHDPGHATALHQVTAGKKVVVVRTFSKVFGLAGARIGYAIGPTSQINAMSSWHLYATVSRLALEASRAALGDTQHVGDTVALADQVKPYCYGEFDQMGLSYIPSETCFFMVDVGTSGDFVRGELAARGILVRSGYGMPQHLRVSTGTMEEMQNFISALRDILGITALAGPRAPRVTSLGGSYPNPCTTRARASYSVAEAGGRVLLQIFNIQGQHVRTVVDAHRAPGWHEFDWDGTNHRGMPVASGSYFYRLTVGEFSQTRRLILVR